ncbi:glycoside hydrolase family 79 protein [Coniophora puteana RWD-64-598 SS2]|uniref:Glycoside hydrolase family 79 protein n=1 Tax=Coniophora puteana (strain RWD-64-598) TaxID=741705 RepID=A0A5M3MY30_CONPW|nr:glycoside hydrolase family 79 protein [Coniophora puteana RWD-64-598 SS2]EIW84073.1 glycoside hydrolase family 79 protein [Coniophora puteana RWD-64-598 SS2]
MAALSVWLALTTLLSYATANANGPPSLPEWATPPLNPALASFSIELAYFTEYMGNQSAPNNLTQNVFDNLKQRTGVSPEVRIGGITADSAFWDPNLGEAVYNLLDSSGALVNTTLGPQFWDAVKLLPDDTNIVLTLDLENLNYTGALSMAEAAWAVLNVSAVGNEPDHYSLDLSAQTYTSYWEPWSVNISKVLDVNYPEFQVGVTVEDPLWPYNTSAAESQFDCVSALAAGADDGDTAKTCSEHTYQYSVCDTTRAADATLTNLVNHTRLAMYLDLWQPRIRAVRDQLGPDSFVIGEFNSVSCGGKDNVTDTFGQAMWLLDTALYAASINVSRFPLANNYGPAQVYPAYSAYLFVADAIGTSRTLQIANIFPGRQTNGSSITTAGGDASAGQLAVYGFWDEASSASASAGGGAEYPSKLALLNMQIYNETDAAARPSVTVDISAYLPSGVRDTGVMAKRLVAPGADVKAANATMWAGQTFAHGYAEGVYVEETVYGGRVEVEASSAVLVYW